MGNCCNGGVDSAQPISKNEPKITETLPREEQIIIENEKKLEFSKLNSKDIIKSLKSEGSQNCLSMPQLKRAFFDLQLSETDLSSPDSAFYKILAKLKNDKKLYEIRKLVLLALLVGKGAPQDKAVWLFKQYDLDASGVIDAEEVETMLNEMIDLAVNILPLSARGDEEGCLTKEEEDTYKSMLLAGQQSMVQEVMKLLLNQNEIGETEFVAKICDPSQQLNKLLWSYGVRLLLKNYGNHNNIESH
ncbi:unnamed protein product [Blepharisma stoltei]|uniref:EF-hand domain-containing protein n=1 Tax=Blepharisma stoltei TaxID=1481888 RepID=A0AAU9IXQ2_9CILI|nr:unnamed protein product [Blepharisma stoltei]